MATRRRKTSAPITPTQAQLDAAEEFGTPQIDFGEDLQDTSTISLTPEDAKKFHDWEKSMEDNIIDIAHKVGAEAPELTHEEMLEIAEERESAAEFVDSVVNDVLSQITESEQQSNFEPVEVRPPAVPTGSRKPTVKKPQRYTQRNETRRRKN